ncbi:MAG TPA: 50S ribosomal protein L11 methyltransferase [Alphaproteobacteria bacterium]|nr:50S ribosomal protein L11 methyltransferase [Alphaproteobacteria bacterium]HOO50331.1 50S ribosomal protein L11 methyltransferase [Alphaproteobacteria bacterium]
MTSDGTGNTGLISLYCRVPTPLEDHIVMDMASLLDEEAISTSWEKDTELGVDKGWTLMWVLENLPAIPNFLKSLSKISGLKITEDHLAWQNVPDVNWLEESYKSFPPFRVGPFFVHGSHFDGKIPKGLMPLQIDAATAFGSGEHGTTRGCLDALIKLHKSGFKPKTILDMGSGSGILAIAAYKLWKKPVLAVDIDKEATKVAVRHRTINKVPSGPKGMQCATGNGYKAKPVTAQKSGFDLIIANILAGPLVDMAPELSANLRKNGKAVLSGLLIEQENPVLHAHLDNGLCRPSRLPRNEWQTLILNKLS